MNLSKIIIGLSGRDTLIAAGLVQRTTVLILTLVEHRHLAGDSSQWVTLFATLCCAYSAILLALLLKGSRPLDRIPVLIVDVLLALVVNTISVAFVPTGDYLTQGYNLFWQYLLGTVVVVTARIGTMAGSVVVFVAAACQTWLAFINEVSPTLQAALQWADRVGWLAAAVAIPALVTRFAGAGQRLAQEAGLVEGRARARKDMLHELHDTIAQWLGEIVRRSGDERVPESERLADARAAATAAIDAEQKLLAFKLHSLPRSLSEGLEAFQREFEELGLFVTFDTDQLLATPSAESSEAILLATREVLVNVFRHAGVHRATVRLFSTSQFTTVEVVDLGIGFDPSGSQPGYGLRGSVRDRIQALGGTVSITSAPRQGTRVTLSVPNIPMPENATLEAFTTWFPVPALAYRVFLTPLQILLAISVSGVPLIPALWSATGIILIIDVVGFVLALRDRLSLVLKIRAVVIVDVGILAAVNIWQWTTLPQDQLLGQGNQVFWGYLFGAVILWTGIRGGRFGLRIVLLGAALELPLLLITTQPMGEAIAGVINAVGKLIIAWVLTLLLSKSARRATYQGREAGRSAGRLLTTVEDLERVRSRAMDALKTMAEISGSPAQTRILLGQLRGRAIVALANVRASLDHHSPAQEPNSLIHRLEQALQHVVLQGTKVELVNAAIDHEPSKDQRDILVSGTCAVVEMLCHGISTPHIIVAVSSDRSLSRVVVRDRSSDAASVDLVRLRSMRMPLLQVTATMGGLQGVRVELSVQATGGVVAQSPALSEVVLEYVNGEDERCND